jgi:hypothetical protein
MKTLVSALFLFAILFTSACSSPEKKLEKQMRKDAKHLAEISCQARGRMLELLREGNPLVNNDSTYVQLRREQQQLSAGLNEKYGMKEDQRKLFGDILKEERQNSKTCNEVKEKYGLDEVSGDQKPAE